MKTSIFVFFFRGHTVHYTRTKTTYYIKMSPTTSSVDLGYFNGDYSPWDLKADYETWELASRHFPSKVCGRPAWLDLQNLPPSTLIKVGSLSTQSVQLAQQSVWPAGQPG